jgi:sulfatase maturation enzyme AslB (radical SAM superfamily)
MVKIIRVHTILFTEACPLACRYCDLKNDTCFGTAEEELTFDRIKESIAKYDKEDNPNLITSRLLFTGGEPFLAWPQIKEIIEQYGSRFQYCFNTSGYLFTEEILEFLSHYDVSFVLSVDGNEALTNYLRPVKSSPYHVGYFKKLKTIIPTLLYYFPKTPFRIIINPRYVNLLYEQWLEADKLGFKFFTFVLDFESRPERDLPNKKKWSDKDTQILSEQIDLILRDIIIGFVEGIKKPTIVEIDEAVQYLLNPVEFSPENLPCEVFSGRTLNTLYSPEKHDYCMASYYPNKEDAKEALMEAYNKRNHHCLKDEECLAFEYCAYRNCPQSCLTRRNGFFDFETLECIIRKISYYGALKFLKTCNEICPEASLYTKYLNSFYYKGKEEALN